MHSESPVTKDCYLRRMKVFFNHINLLPNGNLEEQCNLFATKGLEDQNGHSIILLNFYNIKRKE